MIIIILICKVLLKLCNLLIDPVWCRPYLKNTVSYSPWKTVSANYYACFFFFSLNKLYVLKTYMLIISQNIDPP